MPSKLNVSPTQSPYTTERMHDAASPSSDQHLLHFCMCRTCTRLKYCCFQCSIPERISHISLCTQSDVLVFQSYFPSPHSPPAFRLILSEAEIHNSSEEHSICSIVRSLPVAGSALARGKPHGASPSRFFPFLP